MVTEKPHVTAEQLKDYIRRHGNSAANLDLSGRSLSGETLSGMVLRGIIFFEADLRGALLNGAHLENVDLRGADLSSPLLREGSEPFETKLDGANLQGVDLRGANLSKAKLRRTNLQAAQLQGCNLAEADLEGADLSSANLEDAILTGAKLNGANLTLAVLRGADLTKANLHQTIFSDTRLDQENLGNELLQEMSRDYLDAKYIYLALKDNFHEIGAYDAASWAYVKERLMERETYKPQFAHLYYYTREVPDLISNLLWKWFWISKFYVKYIWYYFRSSFYWYFFGYGEKPFRTLYFCLVSISIFSLLYYFTGGLENEKTELPPSSFVDYLLHSFGAFTTIPYLRPVEWWAKVFTSLEAMTGVTALAAFTTALTRRIGSR
jgi:uncharacterized protein YjbI with pentapeptide repeats